MIQSWQRQSQYFNTLLDVIPADSAWIDTAASCRDAGSECSSVEISSFGMSTSTAVSKLPRSSRMLTAIAFLLPVVAS